MSKLLIATCTRAKTDKEFESRPIYESLRKQFESNSNVDFCVFKDNKKGLSESYNLVLNDPNNLNKTVLFVHDDVVLDDIFLYDKLVASPFSITGLAGTKSYNTRSPNLAWHLSSQKQDYVGEVAHAKGEETWTTVFGPSKSRCLIIDGLFISCKIKDLADKQLTFDENFKFHFYDIAFCLQANKKRVSCGVLPIKATHYGMGDSMHSQEWSRSNELFKTLYCK
jgi:hypothetical protein